MDRFAHVPAQTVYAAPSGATAMTDAELRDRFRALRDALDGLVRSVFPEAEPVEAHGMTGWQVALRDPPPAETWKSTFDRTHFQVFLAPGKAGVTLHVWHPDHPHLLREHEGALSAAGWRVMVGCLRWSRKAGPPLESLRAVLESVRR